MSKSEHNQKLKDFIEVYQSGKIKKKILTVKEIAEKLKD